MAINTELALIFAAFGLIIGSFLNVVILRFGERDLGGRSACMSCHKILAWYDMVPVVSWIVLGGRCRMCGASISVQYPLVEALTAFLFAVIGSAVVSLYGQNILLLCAMVVIALAIAALFVAIGVYDLYHTIIPDPWVYSFGILALVSQILMPGQTLTALSIAVLSGPAIAAPLYALWRFSGGAAMGFGDVKFALGMGWLLGLSSGFVALFLSFIIGAIVSIPLLILSSEWWSRVAAHFSSTGAAGGGRWGFTMKSEVPFGPFLILATLTVWLLEMHGVHLDFFA